jgi:hypothetical protein
MQGAQNQREIADTELQRQLDTLGQYSNDFAREIQNRQATPDTADDALIPYLTAARNAKVAAQQSAQNESAQTQYEQAFKMFETTGTASGWVAQALGLPEGATTRQYLDTLYDVGKPYYSPNSGGGSGGSTANQQFTQMMTVWKATGEAPAGLEAWGVQPGTKYGDAKASQVSMAAANKDIVDTLKIGAQYDDASQMVSSTTAQAAYNQLKQMVDDGTIDGDAADVIVESNPALAAYAKSLITSPAVTTGRTMSQTRTP